jgi:hypothetical protein
MFSGARPLTDVALWARSNGLEIVLLVTGAILLARLAPSPPGDGAARKHTHAGAHHVNAEDQDRAETDPAGPAASPVPSTRTPRPSGAPKASPSPSETPTPSATSPTSH